jgi:hypothetical protein
VEESQEKTIALLPSSLFLFSLFITNPPPK